MNNFTEGAQASREGCWFARESRHHSSRISDRALCAKKHRVHRWHVARTLWLVLLVPLDTAWSNVAIMSGRGLRWLSAGCWLAGCWLALIGCDGSAAQTGTATTTDAGGSSSASSQPSSSDASPSDTTSDIPSTSGDLTSARGSSGETTSGDVTSDAASESTASATSAAASETQATSSTGATTEVSGETADSTATDDAGTQTTSPPTGDWAAPTPAVCSFEIGVENSAFIASVGLVQWSTDLPDVGQARIEFVLTEPESGELNLGSGGPISPDSGRALLLGLKSGRSYTYHIIAGNGETDCVSPDQVFITPTNPDLPTITQVTSLPDAIAPGFIVASTYGRGPVVIIDTDGDVVWWYDTTLQTSRVHMDWAGEYVWMMAGNGAFGAASNGKVMRVKLDGSEAEAISGLEFSHHDFAVLPEGATAYLIGDPDGNDDGSYLVERAADGTLTSLVRLDADSYLGGTQFHANALRYYASDDSYTVGDLSLGGIAKFNRQGQLLSQYGGCSAESGEPKCVPVSMPGNHGHQLLENGNLLVFLATIGNSSMTVSPVYEYAVTEASGVRTATEVWSYSSDASSLIFGDVGRLANGNTLITYSSTGIIVEVTPDKQVARKLTSTNFGYSTFRTTLYGPPQ